MRVRAREPFNYASTLHPPSGFSPRLLWGQTRLNRRSAQKITAQKIRQKNNTPSGTAHDHPDHSRSGDAFRHQRGDQACHAAAIAAVAIQPYQYIAGPSLGFSTPQATR